MLKFSASPSKIKNPSIRPLSPRLVKKINIITRSEKSYSSSKNNSSKHSSELEQEFQKLKAIFPYFFKNISEEVILFEHLTNEQQKEIAILFQTLRTGMLPLPKNISEKVNSLKLSKISEKELLSNLMTKPPHNPKVLQKQETFPSKNIS